MMEPTSTGALAAALPVPSANPPAAGDASAAPSSRPTSQSVSAAASAAGAVMLRQLSSVQMPKVIKDRTDELEKRINATDIARINGYMRVVNLVAAALLAVTCFIRMWESPSYSHFLVIIYIMILAAGLAFIENHERFPSIADKVKTNFGFMFNAKGKAAYILSISFLAFSQGWIGCILGGAFLLLALFNFFIIYRHPAYQAHMTKTEAQQQQEEDLEDMPELRYNQSKPAVVTVAVAAAPAVAQPTAHVVV